MPLQDTEVKNSSIHTKQLVSAAVGAAAQSSVAVGSASAPETPPTTATQSGTTGCRVIATSNIALDETTTAIDGITLADNDIVAVAGQTDATGNGIYRVSTTTDWVRTDDVITEHTLLDISEGDDHANTIWGVTNAAPIELGATALSIKQVDKIEIDIGSTVKTSRGWVFTSTSGTFSFGSIDGNGRQIINYEPAIPSSIIKCRLASDTNITLSTSTTTVDGIGVATGDTILVAGQNTASENGVYAVPASGAWTRTADVIDANTYFSVSEGNGYKDSLWRVLTDGAITLGATSLSIKALGGTTINLVGTGIKYHSYGFGMEAGSGITIAQSSTDGNGRPIYTFAVSGGLLPSGSANNTLYHNGTSWVANSTLITDGSTVAIGATLNESTMLYVQGTDTGIYSEVTGEGGVAISGYSGNNGTGTQGQGDGASGIGVRGYAPDGGTAVKGESPDGYAGHFVSTSNFAVFGDTNTGVAAHFRQTGTLSANTGNGVLWATRNLTLTGFNDATGAVLRVEDATAATGDLASFTKQGAELFAITADKRIRVGGRVKAAYSSYTLLGTTNDDIVIDPVSYIHLYTTSGSSLAGIAGGVNEEIVEFNAQGLPFKIEHNSSTSSAGNRIYTTTGGDIAAAYGFKAQYRTDHWAVLSVTV